MKNTIKVRIATDLTAADTKTGSTVVTFRGAENKAYTDRKTGRTHRVTKFYTFKGWNGMGKSLQKNLKKGDLAEFGIDIQPNSWIDKKTGELNEELICTVNNYRRIRQARAPQTA